MSTPTETATHTPGPWVAEAGETNGNEHGAWGCVSSIPVGLFVASVWADVERLHGEAEANARLIAAAPDLLEALMDLLNVVAVDELIPESVSYMRQARAAIAKAEGK